jgi:biotin operon repressor
MAEWTEEELEYLKEHYGKVSSEEIAKHLKRSRRAVLRKAYELRRAGLMEKVSGYEFLKKDLNLCKNVCKVRTPAGEGLSGQKLFYCPRWKIVVGEDSLALGCNGG